MSSYYTLAPGGIPVPEPDHMTWARWMERQRNDHGGMLIVGRTTVGPYIVCTDFLGINQNWRPHGEPILFETMIRAPDGFLDYQERAHRIDEALSMHERAVSWVRSHLTDATSALETEVGPME